MANDLNAHAKPPAKIREVYKRYQKMPIAALDEQSDLVRFSKSAGPKTGEQLPSQLSISDSVKLPSELQMVFDAFVGARSSAPRDDTRETEQKSNAYQVSNIPGLLIYPNLLPQSVQTALLNKLLHRDIALPQHQTNLHLHYSVPYPPHGESYFSPSAENLLFQPKDPTIHKPFNVQQFLHKKLRWTTLGGQYDWTNKVYPSDVPPAFPPDIKSLVEDIFPMKAEAAIVNLYSPGDTLSLHRDVSEECDRPLVSISLGCDAIFVCGLDAAEDEEEPRVAVMRLRSGDAVLMSGESRHAWHGVTKVLSDTCPEWMASWPAQDSSGQSQEYEQWRGWMNGKRVNLNVRQMFA